MTNKFIYAEDIAFEDSGLADKKELEETEHQFSVKEACDILNKQHKIIERQKRIIRKQEMILSDISIVLQDYYDKVCGKGYVRINERCGKWLRHQIQMACISLIQKIAEDLGVELNG